MHYPILRSLVLVCAFFLLIAPVPAQARNTDQVLPVKDAMESDQGKAVLFDVPLFFKGAKHPAVKEKLIQVSTHQSTRGAFRSDEASCRVAFLSALKVLQQRAQQEGGDAVIEIVSITRDKQTESATEYRCVAGAMVVHVGLKGRVVKLR